MTKVSANIKQFSKGTNDDAKFFNSDKKSEIVDLRKTLQSSIFDVKRDGIKKVIALMTLGKDVSQLFPDVIHCIQTESLELKKLVYLYLINYAKVNPDLTLMAVNTFVKDASDPNPLIRALSIRTMGCIRIEKISEYLCEPLRRGLRDDDPYVRKTAAICVAKLYDITPALVEDMEFFDSLRDALGDSNPTVVANAVASISEISAKSGKEVVKLTTAVLQKLLAALNECTEWGQVFILDILCNYIPANLQEVEGIIDRVTPRLQHANSAVVLSAVKVVLHFMDEITDEDKLRQYHKKLGPPLVSLLNADHVIQYTALRFINLIVLKNPKLLEHEIKVFFCKYNDPVYVKIEKLQLMILLVSERNVDQVLLELKEYATEVDVEFVRKSVSAIGNCAIKLDKATPRCIDVLIELIQTRVNYVVQEAIVVIKDIFRKYPNRYDKIIGFLCENLEVLDEPMAKASMIWIIGEYAEKIENADELLLSFIESFQEETNIVQLQLLTATVKLYLKYPDTTQDTVQNVLNMATEESENPDLRDRGYIYWRLLSTDPEAARAVVLAEKPIISDTYLTFEPHMLDELLMQIPTLAAVYHKPPESFSTKAGLTADEGEAEEEDEEGDDDLLDQGDYASRNDTYTSAPSNNNNNSNNLLDMDEPVAAPTNSGPAVSIESLLTGNPPISGSINTSSVPKTVYLTNEAGQGVSIRGVMKQGNNSDQLLLDLDVCNATSAPLNAIAVQFNKNLFGIAPVSPMVPLPSTSSNGSITSVTVPLTKNNQASSNPADQSGVLQVAMKNMSTNNVCYFTIPVGVAVVLKANSNISLDLGKLASSWKENESQEVSAIVNNIKSIDVEYLKDRLCNSNDNYINFILKRDIPGADGQSALYFAASSVSTELILIEIKTKIGMSVVKISVRSINKGIAEIVKTFVTKLFEQ